MNLRFLTVADMPAFRDLRLQGLKETPTAYLHVLAEELQKPDAYHENMLKYNTIIGAFDTDTLVGFAIMSRSGAIKHRHKCHIWGAYVRPDYRNRKIGQSMRLALFDHARNLGCDFCLSAIVADNPASLAMHESVGYVRMYVEKNGIKHRDDSYSDIIHLVRWL